MSTLLAIAVSASMLALLGLRDAKRLRNAAELAQSDDVQPLSPLARRLCAVLALVPGVALASIGHWWAFFVWLGATCMMGWVAAHLLTRRRDQG